MNPSAIDAIKRLFKGNQPSPIKGHEVAAGVAALAGIVLLVTGGGLYVAGLVTGSEGLKIAGGVLLAVGLVCLQIVMPLITVGRLINAAMSAGQSFLQASKAVLASSSAVIGVTKAANVVGLVIGVGIIWGFFIYQVAQGGLNAVQISTLVALAIAQTIIAILMFVLSCTVVGAIIVAIFAIVDFLITLFGDFSVSGWIAEQIAKALYHYEVIVTPGVNIANMDMQPADPGLGMASSNFLNITTTLTNTVTHKDPEDWRVVPYMPIFYTDRYLRSSTIWNQLSTISQTVIVSRYAMSNEWNVTHDHDWGATDMRRATTTPVVAVSNVPLRAGINMTVPLYLNSGFALPGASCWTIPIPIPVPPFYIPVPVCYLEDFETSVPQDIGSSMFFDIFPPTLDEFYSLTWANFGPQKDHDSDGLFSTITGGNDPNDNTWDTDADGLSDRYEVEMRARAGANGGARPSPLSRDTDGDGVCDDMEVRFGSYPNQRDTDGDGLNDGGEVWHYNCISGQWEGGWDFVVTSVVTGTGGITSTRTLTTHVSSDPLMVDSDSDGLNDLAERTLKTNPNVRTPSPLVLYTDVDDPDRFVRPGQTFAYTATVENKIEHTPGLFVLGGMTVTAPSVLGSGVYTRDYNIYQKEAASLPLTFTVSGSAGTGQLAINNATVGRMHDGDLATYYKWDPAPSVSAFSVSPSPAYGRIVAGTNLSSGSFAVASAEGTTNARFRHAESVLSAATEVRNDTRCGPGLGQVAPGVACADNGQCLTTWSNTNYHSGQNTFRLTRFYEPVAVRQLFL